LEEIRPVRTLIADREQVIYKPLDITTNELPLLAPAIDVM
jgi:hypothetical protein